MDNLERVAALIKLMHEGRVKKLEAGDIKLELSDTYFYEQIGQSLETVPQTEEKSSSRTLVDDEDPADDAAMLLWSTPAGT